MNTTRRLWVVLFCVVLAALVGCSSLGSWYVESGVLRDRMYSVELRRSGTVYAWMVHDETGVYCFEPVTASREQLEEWLRAGQEVIVSYKESRLIQGSPCWGGEWNSEGSGFEVFVVTGIEPVR